MAGEEPIERRVARDLELGHHLALAVRAAADVGDARNPIEHQHRRQRQLRIARPEELTTATGEEICVFVGCNALGHRPPSTKCRCANGTCALFYPRQACPITLAPRSKARVPGARPARDGGGEVDRCPAGNGDIYLQTAAISKLRDDCRSGSALGGGPHRQSSCAMGNSVSQLLRRAGLRPTRAAHCAGSAVVWQRRPACHGRTAARGGRARRSSGSRSPRFTTRCTNSRERACCGKSPLAASAPISILTRPTTTIFCRGTRPPGRHSRRHDPVDGLPETAGGSENFAY